jgi:hypothetical protein
MRRYQRPNDMPITAFLASSLALAFAATIAAQTATGPTPADDAQAAAGKRAGKAIARSAAAVDIAFRVRWGPDLPPVAGDPPRAPATAGGVRGNATGSWHDGVLLLRLAGEPGDDFLFAGGRTLARDTKRPWALRRGRHADGTVAPFLPDVRGLMDFLAARDLPTTHAGAGAIDDRPVEVVTTTLTAEQAAEAVWSGLLPESFVVGLSLTLPRGGARAPAPLPTATVDVAVHFDPAGGAVRRVHVRSWLTPEIQRGGRIAMRFNAEGRPERVDPADVEADEAANAEARKQPLRFDDGLPLRPRRGLLVSDLVLDLGEPGKTTAPELDAAARALLQR